MRSVARGLSVAFAMGLVLAAHEVRAQPEQVRHAGATLVFESDLPSTYELWRVRYSVDGLPRYGGARPFEAPLPPGEHVVSIVADYRLHDPLFPYLSGYAIELRSAQHIRAAPGRVFSARAVQTGGVTTRLERRARIAWQ